MAEWNLSLPSQYRLATRDLMTELVIFRLLADEFNMGKILARRVYVCVAANV